MKKVVVQLKAHGELRMLEAQAGLCKMVLLKMTSEAIANFCDAQSTIKSMKSFVSKTL